MEWHLSTAWVPAASSVVALALGYLSFTKPRDHPRATTACIAMPALFTLYNVKGLTPDPNFNSFYAYAILMWLAHVYHLHCFLSITKPLPKKLTTGHSGTEYRWLTVYKLLFNMRTKSVIPISQPPPITISKRLSFVGSRILRTLLKYILLCVLYDPLLDLGSIAPGGTGWMPSDYTPDRQIVFRRIACWATYQLGFPICNAEWSTDTTSIIRGVILRLQLLAQVIMHDSLSLSAFHDGFAALAVGIGLDTPEEWLPPLYGNVGEAYTVRRFWSRFWHHLIYNSFSAIAAAFSARVLHIRKGTLLARYSSNALFFVLSGLMHGIVVRLFNPACASWRGAILFFLMQIGAIVAEDMVRMLWRSVVEKRLKKGLEVLDVRWRVLKRVVGYIWVIAWLSYSMSVKSFPQIRCSLSES